MSRVLISLLVMFVVAIFTGCSSIHDDETVDSGAELANGWREYASGNYESAILAFEKSLNGESPATANADSYNGLGWTYLGISQDIGVNSANLDSAIGKFEKAMEKDQTNADALVGHAVALLLKRSNLDDYREAVKLVDLALNSNSVYMYRHDYKSSADLHAFKSQCYYYLGEIDKAGTEAHLALSMDGDNATALSIKRLIY